MNQVSPCAASQGSVQAALNSVSGISLPRPLQMVLSGVNGPFLFSVTKKQMR